MTGDEAPLSTLLGVEGLALLRGLHEPGADPAARIAEVRALADRADSPPPAESSVQTGYAIWSDSYDDPGNPIVDLEQPIVWSMLAELSPGRALDAACGSGRHTRHLLDLGHSVTGVDLTAEMLARATATAPEATLLQGDLRALPVADSSVDVLVCGLALSHLADPRPALAEFARVLAPEGHALLSVLHPLQVHLGWHATFRGVDGSRGFVREHPHGHAVYLRAFRRAGLKVLDCAEPVLRADQLSARRRLHAAIPDATREAYAGLPGALIWHLRR